MEWNLVVPSLCFFFFFFYACYTSRYISTFQEERATWFSFFFFHSFSTFNTISRGNWNSTFVSLICSSSTALYVPALHNQLHNERINGKLKGDDQKLASNVECAKARRESTERKRYAVLLHISEGRYIQLAFATARKQRLVGSERSRGNRNS